MPFLVLGLLLLLPLVEIAGFILMGKRLGVGGTLGMIVLTGVVGVMIVRWQGLGVVARAQGAMAENRMPVREVFEGVCLAAAGILLIIPGFLTDAVGFVLLIPPVRRWLYARAAPTVAADNMAHGDRPPPEQIIIEGDYSVTDENDSGPSVDPSPGDDRRDPL